MTDDRRFLSHACLEPKVERDQDGLHLIVPVECRSYDSITVSSTWELTSVSIRYSQEDGVYTSLARISYRTHMLVSVLCLGVCSLVLPTARSCAVWDDNNKDNVCTPSIPAGLKCPPPSKTISSITWFEA